MGDAYRRLRDYADGLAARQVAFAAWKRRNPGADELDDDAYRELVSRDPRPRTDDLVTAQRFHDLMSVALVAYEGRNADQWDRQERILWRLLTGLMVVSIICVIVVTAYGVMS